MDAIRREPRSNQWHPKSKEVSNKTFIITNMGVLNLPDEILTVGELGKFWPLPISGWDKGRSDTISSLRKSYKWDSTVLIRTLISCYHNAGVWFSGIRISVATFDKWLTGTQGTIPPHQLFNWCIDGGMVHGFIYVGPKIEIVEGSIINVDNIEDPISYYNGLCDITFSLYLNDDEIEHFLGRPANELYIGYIHGNPSI